MALTLTVADGRQESVLVGALQADTIVSVLRAADNDLLGSEQRDYGAVSVRRVLSKMAAEMFHCQTWHAYRCASVVQAVNVLVGRVLDAATSGNGLADLAAGDGQAMLVEEGPGLSVRFSQHDPVSGTWVRITITYFREGDGYFIFNLSVGAPSTEDVQAAHARGGFQGQYPDDVVVIRARVEHPVPWKNGEMPSMDGISKALLLIFGEALDCEDELMLDVASAVMDAYLAHFRTGAADYEVYTAENFTAFRRSGEPSPKPRTRCFLYRVHAGLTEMALHTVPVKFGDWKRRIKSARASLGETSADDT